MCEIMEKDFDLWNEQQKKLNRKKRNFYGEREIRWCSLGLNIGSEQDGRRPVLVIKRFNRNTCLAVPLTTSQNKNKYFMSVGVIDDKEAFVNISQVRLIDVKRLHTKLATLDQKKFEEIRKAIRDLI